MPRLPRSAIGNMVYHVINRANARMPIFKTDADYLAFEDTLTEAKNKYPLVRVKVSGTFTRAQEKRAG